jgi:hypothetical protein
MKTLLLTIAAIFINLSVEAFPCNKYVLDFRGKVMPGEISISWSINTGSNNCGFQKEEILKHRFVIRIESLFEDVILRDTIDQNHFSINTNLTDDIAVILFIEELGRADHSLSLLIKPERDEMPEMHSTLDTINFFLMNGYFLNAASLLNAINKKEVIDQVKTEYDILFPENYPDEQTYFNSYVDSTSMTLIKMPILEGLPAFLEALNELAKNDLKADKGFKVFVEIYSNGKPREYEVIPNSAKPTVDKLVQLVTFSKPINENGQVVTIVGRSKNKKKFTIVNERALMDQRLPGFKTRFPYRGAVH